LTCKKDGFQAERRRRGCGVSFPPLSFLSFCALFFSCLSLFFLPFLLSASSFLFFFFGNPLSFSASPVRGVCASLSLSLSLSLFLFWNLRERERRGGGEVGM